MGIREFFKNNVFAKPIDDDLFFSLNIWQKLVGYRRVPVKLLINLTVCAMLVTFSLKYQLFANDYAIKGRYAVALTMISPPDETDSSLSTTIHNIGEFEDFLVGFIGGYYYLPMSSLGVFMHFAVGLNDPTPLPVQLWIRYATDKTYKTKVDQTFDLDEENPLGPFSNVTALFPQNETCIPLKDGDGNTYVPCRNDSIADFFDVIEEMKLSATIRGVQSNPSVSFASVLKWKIVTDFTFSAHNSILTAATSIQFTETQRLLTEPIIMALVMMVVTLWGVLLRLYFFLRHFDYATKALSPALLRRYRETVGWHYFGLVAGGLTTVFCVVTLSSQFLNFADYDLVQWRSVVLGIAIFFEFVLLLSHFQNVPRMYLIAQSITTALPSLTVYFLSIFPIFFGFALAASAALGGTSVIFNSLPTSMVTLFCMICGDSLIDVFTQSNTTSFGWLQGFNSILLAAFVFIFIANVVNMALALVQDSYGWVTETHDVEEKIHKRIQRSQRHSNLGSVDSLSAAINTVKALEGGGDYLTALEAQKKARNGNGDFSGKGNNEVGRKRWLAATSVEPFEEEELEALRCRFTVHRTEVDSSGSEWSDEDDGDEAMNAGEEVHFHRNRFHQGSSARLSPPTGRNSRATLNGSSGGAKKAAMPPAIQVQSPKQP